MLVKLDARNKFLEKAKAQVKSSYEKRDSLVIQTARAIDDCDSARSLLMQRLAEWVRINFPEFPTQSDELMARLYAEFGCKEDFEFNRLAELTDEDKATKLMERREKSFGIAFNMEDKKAVQALARSVVALFETRKELESYVKVIATKEMPNVSLLAEPILAARLLSLAGSLQNLAEMPASTIQVIGAENALFKHLRTGSLPPKHGIIFQYSAINSAPLYQRGKIARALAAKIAIAAKADFYTKRFIADKLKANFEEHLEKIRGAPAKPRRKPVFEKREERRFERPRFGSKPGFGKPRFAGGFKRKRF